ncbi:MAG: stage III sporulation protein AF [Firmicutes bacterium]|nr:stage III sporulation protein AF [Bacillota bacterium]
MLRSFNAYIKIIASFLIFSAFVEIILPDTKFRKYIMMVCGLIMISVLISPIFNFEIDSDEIFDFDTETEEYSEIAEKYGGIRKELVNEIYEDISSENSPDED